MGRSPALSVEHGDHAIPKGRCATLGRYVLKNYPSAKIAVLYQNDDFGRDYVRVFKDALGHALDKMIVTGKANS